MDQTDTVWQLLAAQTMLFHVQSPILQGLSCLNWEVTLDTKGHSHHVALLADSNSNFLLNQTLVRLL